MSSRYNVLRPGAYPIAWITAAQQAVDRAEAGQDPWVSVDWSRGESGAVNRMKRLWAFREGLRANPGDYPGISKIFAEQKTLRFRKLQRYGVWDIQVSVGDELSSRLLMQSIREFIDKT